MATTNGKVDTSRVTITPETLDFNVSVRRFPISAESARTAVRLARYLSMALGTPNSLSSQQMDGPDSSCALIIKNDTSAPLAFKV